MRATFRPLLWIGPSTPTQRRRSRYTFKASWQDTLDLLSHELRLLGASEVVIEADFQESDIRLDGWPRANARTPNHPGVRVAFESKHGPLIYQTDNCAFWQHNVRSIALGLESLRAVDRYGITSRAEQYAGWKALPSQPKGASFATVDDALRWLRDPDNCGVAGGEGLSLKVLLRLVAKQHHPDRGGDQATWARYDEAVQLLKKASMV